KAKYPNTEFHVCGFCEEDYEEVLNQYEKQGIIIYHGMVRNIVEVLEKMHCTIHPTYYPEGMSNVLLESAACGKPLITTNQSVYSEIVDEGVNGIIIKEKNNNALIKRNEKFILKNNEKRKKMVIKSREKVANEFSRELVVKKYRKQIN